MDFFVTWYIITIAFLYPSFKEITCTVKDRKDEAYTNSRRCYWVVASVLYGLTEMFGFLISWLPFYSLTRMALMTFMVTHPDWRDWVYESVVEPLVLSQRENVDDCEKWVRGEFGRLYALGMTHVKTGVSMGFQYVMLNRPSFLKFAAAAAATTAVAAQDNEEENDYASDDDDEESSTEHTKTD